MKIKQWIAVLLALAALLVPLTACGSSSNDSTTASENTTTQAADDSNVAESDDETTEADAATEIKWSITIPGASGSLCNSPTYLAYELGYFAEEGIDVELITADFETKRLA